jgi:hypothetical protein
MSNITSGSTLFAGSENFLGYLKDLSEQDEVAIVGGKHFGKHGGRHGSKSRSSGCGSGSSSGSGSGSSSGGCGCGGYDK